MKEIIKQVKNYPYAKQVFPYLVLATCSLAIWYLAPFIAMADSAPLAQPEKRLYAILVLFISYFLKTYLFDSKPQEEVEAAPSKTDPDQKLKALIGHFEGAVNFLKKTVIQKNNKNVSLSQLPWYLFIGSQHAGKTSLLANANVNYILSKQFKNENLQSLPASEVCDWWVTREIVILDVPSIYLSPRKTLSGELTPHPVWTYFISLLKKFNAKQSIAGVVFAISLPELMTSKNAGRDRFLNEIKQRMMELRARFGEGLPIYLTITKCDLLPGFIEFFGDAGQDEISQAWGVTIPELKERSHLLNAFNQRFNALIKRINKQLIWRLHHERNPFARPYVKDFPLQLERVKENLLNLLKALTLNDPNFNLQSVYLSSALQVTKEPSAAPLQAANTSTRSLQIMKSPIMPSRPYFVKQLLLQGFLYKSSTITAPAKVSDGSKRLLAYGFSAAAAVIAVLVLGNDFRNSLQQTYAIRSTLAQYKTASQQTNPQESNLLSALPLLNALQKTAEKPQALIHFSDKATQSASTAYREALSSVVLPEIKRDLENYLQTASKNPDEIYNVFKAYIMLGDADHMNVDFILQTLQRIAPALFDDKNREAITAHINAAFSHGWHPISLDENLNSQIRLQLAKLETVQLANLILKSEEDNNTLVTLDLGIDKKSDLFNTDGLNNQIPKMYTPTNFDRIYNQEIETAATEAVNGSWVLGNYSNNTSPQPLQKDLQLLYAATYAKVWENILASIHLTKPENLAQTQKLMAALSDQQSKLQTLFKAINKNIALTPVLTVSPKLKTIYTVTNNEHGQPDTLATAFSQLKQFSIDLGKVVSSADVNEASFNAAMAHAKSAGSGDALDQLYVNAISLPEPLQNWVSQLADASWHFELEGTANYIKQHWKTSVMSTYHTQIENRFPLFPKSSLDISLDQFQKFLGTHGTITQFYLNYLSPFVDLSDDQLEWKKINNQTLPLSQTVLTYIVQIVNLQHNYFPANNDELSYKFTLQPQTLGKEAKEIHLSINGQSIDWDKTLPRIPQSLNWPGNLADLKTQVEIQLQTNDTTHASIDGDWGWWRLVNTSSPTKIDKRRTDLTFVVDGHKAKYTLFTEGQSNPFLLLDTPALQLKDDIS